MAGTVEREIKIAGFSYLKAIPHPQMKGEEILVAQTARQGDVIELEEDGPDDEKGQRLGAFVTDADREQAEEAPASAFDPETATDDELVAWIKGENGETPTVDDVVDAADDAETAERLLDAENAATDNNPRKGVESGLESIIEGQ